MNVEDHADRAASGIAASIGEPARARMLYCLVDGRARTSTELAMVAGVTPSTASVHLQRLKSQRLVKVFAQGKHRYYSLEGANVAVALESLSVLAGGSPDVFVPNTPNVLRAARRRSKLLVLISRQLGNCDVVSHTPAWTGVSDDRMSVARSERRC